MCLAKSAGKKLIQTIIIWSICVVVASLYSICILQSHQHSIRLFRSVASRLLLFLHFLLKFYFPPLILLMSFSGLLSLKVHFFPFITHPLNLQFIFKLRMQFPIRSWFYRLIYATHKRKRKNGISFFHIYIYFCFLLLTQYNFSDLLIRAEREQQTQYFYEVFFGVCVCVCLWVKLLFMKCSSRHFRIYILWTYNPYNVSVCVCVLRYANVPST